MTGFNIRVIQADMTSQQEGEELIAQVDATEW